MREAAAGALAALAKKDLRAFRNDRAKSRWIAVLPVLLPAEPLEPGEAVLQVRDVQDRSHILHVEGHGFATLRVRQR